MSQPRLSARAIRSAAVERAFLGRALREYGLRLRGPLVDTEVLGRVWLHERDGGVRRRLPLGELASALRLPSDRPHDALSDALTWQRGNRYTLKVIPDQPPEIVITQPNEMMHELARDANSARIAV